MIPKVTVLMPVYNGEKYLKESIESILNQSYKHFEFLIIDDASTDCSAEIILNYKDKRIRYIRNEENLKVAATLNKGLKLAKGEYIARMDCDDIALLNRLETQVAFMEAHDEVGVCGSWFQFYGGFDDRIIKLPVESDLIQARLLFHCVLNHPTVILRKSVLDEYNLIYGNRTLEDYDLWIRAAKVTKIANIPKVLLKYRIHSNQITVTYNNKVQKDVDKQIYKMLRALGIKPNKVEWNLHKHIKYFIPTEYMEMNKDNTMSTCFSFRKDLENWFNKIIFYNEKSRIFDQDALKLMLYGYLERLKTDEFRIVFNLKKIACEKKIYLWGTGNYGLNFFKLLQEHNIYVAGYVDSSAFKWGEVINGIKVYSPKEMEDIHAREKIFIVITSMYHNEISESLKAMGFEREVDFKD